MKVQYRVLKLRPLQTLNRFQENSIDVFQLKATLKDKILFSEYRPHLSLGDEPFETFIQSFKEQSTAPAQKIFSFLLGFTPDLKKISFSNHDFNQSLGSPFLKYKIKHKDDLDFLKIPNKKIRLDANGLFERKEFDEFVAKIPDVNLIDYIEDPLKSTDWIGLKLKTARDFIPGNPFDIYIYKPLRELFPTTNNPIIFSHYMGSFLGSYLCYADLIERGDLSQTHGIVSNGIFQETNIFHHLGSGQFELDQKALKTSLNDILQDKWSDLCVM